MQKRTTIRAGDRVVFRSRQAHAQFPRWYPPAGTVGKVLRVCTGTAWVQWPAGCTGDGGRWFAPLCDLAPCPDRLAAIGAAVRRLLRRRERGRDK